MLDWQASRCRPPEATALPLAPAAPQGCVALCAPVLRTPLPRAGFAVSENHLGSVEQRGNMEHRFCWAIQAEQEAMSEQDAEIQQLKAGVSCAMLLERLPPVWRLDHAESTRRCLKYRRGTGEIVIVNHDGRGWWVSCCRKREEKSSFLLAATLYAGIFRPEVPDIAAMSGISALAVGRRTTTRIGVPGLQCACTALRHEQPRRLTLQ
jgi:hypothetical protein